MKQSADMPVTKVVFNPAMKSKAMRLIDNLERLLAVCGNGNGFSSITETGFTKV